MWNVLECLVILLLASLGVQGAEEDSMENTFNCYADYLKKHGLLDQKFPSESFIGEVHLCDVLLATTADNVYSALLEDFKKNNKLKDAAECILGNLKNLRWSDLDIKEKVFEAFTELTDEVKFENLREVKALQGKVSSEAVVACLSEKEFGDLFEQIFAKDHQEDFVGDYCARKFVLENKLIDVGKYQVQKNPNNLNVSDIKCDVIIKKHFVDADEELRQHLQKTFSNKVDCAISKYKENDFLSKTLSVALLGELGIPEDQKQLEKREFINHMIKITSDLSIC